MNFWLINLINQSPSDTFVYLGHGFHFDFNFIALSVAVTNSLHLNFFTVFHSFYNFFRSIEKINSGSCLVGKNEALFFMVLNFSKQLRREKSPLYAESTPDQETLANNKSQTRVSFVEI